MSSNSESKEYKYFKFKLGDLIHSLQSLNQSEWEEAINLIYYDLNCAIKEYIPVASLPQHNSIAKNFNFYPFSLKSEVQRLEKQSNSCANGTITTGDMKYRRQEGHERSSTINDVLNENLSHLNEQSTLSLKGNFLDQPANSNPEPIAYSILNLCSKNKFYDDKNTIDSEEEAIFNNAFSKRNCGATNIKISQVKKDRLKLPEVQSNNEKLPNNNYSKYDYYGHSNSDHAKIYLCNDNPVCHDLNDSVSNSQKRNECSEIKSKSAEIALWKFQPEIYSEFQASLVDNLDLFNVNFNKQETSDNTAEILPAKEEGKCINNVQLENDSFAYDFSNNLVEISTYKGSNCNNNNSTGVIALNLVNRKEAGKTPVQIKQTDIHSASTTNLQMKDVLQNVSKSPLSCLKCKTEIEDMLDFNEHQLNCSTCKFFCIHCHSQFTKRATFKNHLLAQDRNKCWKCEAVFCHYATLKQHMKEDHNMAPYKKSYSCQYCTRIFYKQTSLFHHYKLHAEENQRVCEKCGIFCHNDRDFNLHMSDHFKTGLQCPKCNELFLRKQQYEKHLRTHENYKCEYCTRTYSCKRKLYKHCSTDHRLKPQGIKLDKLYSCDQCKRTFTRPSYLSLHKKTHSGIKPLECATCSKRFNERRSLLKHYNTYLHQYNAFLNDKTRLIDGDAQFSCPYCPLNLPSERMLQFHCDLVHKTAQQRKCSKCEFETNSKEDYKKHAKCHKKKLFMCEICGKGFLSYSILKDHHIYLHSTERNFKCEVCSKSFKKNSQLLRHMNTHITDKRYKCKCGSGFKQMSNLSRHIAYVHSEDGVIKKQKNATVRKKEGKQNAKDCFETSLEYKNNSIGATNNLVLADDNIPSESQFTVFDSQLIQLVPSALQFSDNLQSVSIINSDLTAFTIPTGYTITHSNDAIEDAANIDHGIIGSQSYSELTPMTCEPSKHTKKKSFNVDINSINVPELGYASISEPESVTLQRGDGVESSLKQQTISSATQILQNIIF